MPTFRRLFLDASDQFAEAASRWPDSALEEDALFRAGESQFFADHYVKANDYFEQLLKKYPNTRYLDLVGARRFVIAQYWLKLNAEPGFKGIGINLTDNAIPWTDTFGHAIRIYDRMRLDDPTGKLADDATIAAANANFTKGNYEKADQYYSDLRTHFPSSEHQFNAHYLGIQAKLRGYRGARYTGEALEETDKLIQQVRRQFPQQVREHEQELDRAAREVRYLLAEREWLMAQYYTQRQGIRGSAFLLRHCAEGLPRYTVCGSSTRRSRQAGRQTTCATTTTRLARAVVPRFRRGQATRGHRARRYEKAVSRGES